MWCLQYIEMQGLSYKDFKVFGNAIILFLVYSLSCKHSTFFNYSISLVNWETDLINNLVLCHSNSETKKR